MQKQALKTEISKHPNTAQWSGLQPTLVASQLDKAKVPPCGGFCSEGGEGKGKEGSKMCFRCPGAWLSARGNQLETEPEGQQGCPAPPAPVNPEPQPGGSSQTSQGLPATAGEILQGQKGSPSVSFSLNHIPAAPSWALSCGDGCSLGHTDH